MKELIKILADISWGGKVDMRKELPTATGHYWWVLKYDGYISAKEIVSVTKYKDKLYASGGEYDFEIKEDDLDEGEEQYWQYIPEPEDP